MITIIDYGLGNLTSVGNALEKIGVPFQISSDPNLILQSSGLILPGVGAAGEGMKNLQKRGLDKIITTQVKKGVPLLGICLGMQLLLSFSEENNVDCLNLIEGNVKKFVVDASFKIPQIGWNQIEKSD